jgi:hypothetical protein
MQDTCRAIRFRVTEDDALTQEEKIMMQHVATITFKDAETSDEAVAIVRRDENAVAVSLSVRHGSDVQVVMNKTDAGALLEALRTALT